MLMFALPIALAQAPSEHVCVTAARTAADVVVDRPPPTLTDFRVALTLPEDERVLPDVSVTDLLTNGELPAIQRPDPHEGGFTFEAGAIRDPIRDDRVLLSVQSRAPDAGLAPLRLTLVLDTSPSMSSVFMRSLPALQDTPPDGAYRPVTRLELAQSTLRALVDRLPDRAVVAVVAMDRGHGQLLLPPTPIQQAPRIHRAILTAAPIRVRGARALDVIEQTTLDGGDPCADTRILMLTDAHARIQAEGDEVQQRVRAWYEQGASLWTLSIGVLDDDTSEAEALTAKGGGLHLRADVLTDAVYQLTQALRASGVVGRDMSVSIDVDPDRVRSIERIDGGGGRDWQRPEVLADELSGATYLLTLVPEASPGPVATVAWSVASAYPGEWAASDRIEVTPLAASEGPPWLRDRVVSLLIGEGLADRDNADWRSLSAIAGDLAGPVGTARELAAWANALAPAPEGIGGLPFDVADPPVAVADPIAAAWLELLRRAWRIDGDHLLDPDVTSDLERLCEAGRELACDAGAWLEPLDPAAAGRVMALACDAGDPIGCLVAGWHDRTVDRQAGWDRFEQACASGLARGCTELAVAMLEGRGTVKDRQGAVAALVPLCRAGEGRGCLALATASAREDRPALYQRAADLGSPGGWELLGGTLTDPDEAAAALGKACDAGRPTACLTLAEGVAADDPAAATAALDAGCGYGSVSVCATAAVWRAEIGAGTVPQARTALQRACEAGDDETCWLDALIAADTPPRSWAPDAITELQHKGLKVDLTEGVTRCYVDRLWRGPARGGLEVLVQLGPGGVIEGAAARSGWADDALNRCVSDAARELGEARFENPGFARLLIRYRLDHEARSTLSEPDTDDVQDIHAIQRLQQARGRRIDQCALQADEPDPLNLLMKVRIGRRGQLREVEVLDSTENPALDACVIEVLSAKSPDTWLRGPVEASSGSTSSGAPIRIGCPPRCSCDQRGPAPGPRSGCWASSSSATGPTGGSVASGVGIGGRWTRRTRPWPRSSRSTPAVRSRSSPRCAPSTPRSTPPWWRRR